MMGGQIVVRICKPVIDRLIHFYAGAVKHEAESSEYAAASHAANEVERRYLANQDAPMNGLKPERK